MKHLSGKSYIYTYDPVYNISPISFSFSQKDDDVHTKPQDSRNATGRNITNSFQQFIKQQARDQL
ncbi:hypothetical protein Glove_95g18 [Diversispora epigaea]|uniref:Uncharacterized protein n=1 Tax=Diversispora epigaea TaxID=1348612 RepID=A0A397J4Z8_9GLOM|nr:hypothetical protein Glove_95g18 [Diversispora epigaea]